MFDKLDRDDGSRRWFESVRLYARFDLVGAAWKRREGVLGAKEKADRRMETLKKFFNGSEEMGRHGQ